MSLGEYVGSGSGTTRLLLHLNGNSTDSSGNDNNGTDVNVGYSNSGLGKCAHFLGSPTTTTYIRVTDHSSLNIRDYITISVWVGPKNTNGGYIVCKWAYNITPDPSQYQIRIRSSTNLLQFHIQTSSGEFSVLDTEACETNKWKYVTGVYDGSNVKLYVNGVLKNQVNATGQIVDINPKSDLGIGSMFQTTTPSPLGRFGGYIDEVIIESRAWSHSEIIKYYTNTLGRYGTI